MNQDEGLLGGAFSRVGHNKRYIVWFYLLNVALAWLGAGAFGRQVHEILDHSLRADRLLHGFDFGVLIGMFARPEFGPMMASSAPAMHFAVLYFIFTALFMPGVLQGYAANFRLPRDEFFRACGRNLWRFIRLMIVAAIVMGIAAGVLFGSRMPLLKKAAESTNELLPFYISMASLCIIFLVMTALRIWFDLAEADVVLSDQRAVRRSIAAGFRHMWRSQGLLLGAYVLIAIVGIAIFVGGLFFWIRFVPSASVFGAVVVSQLILVLLLIMRFWQRGVAVTYYLRSMVEPIAEKSFAPAETAPVAKMPDAPPEPAAT
ncbi:MAG: hypothetical protein WA824_01315 [Candidatus Sulfotelmatobacter sp.]